MKTESYFEQSLPEGTLRGMLHRPSPTSDELVIMLHGFTGHKMESGFLFVTAAREFAKKNISVLRFDFLGSGESDGVFHEMTFNKEKAQARAVLEDVMTWPWVKKIYLLGFSMGGALAAQLAAEFNTTIDKLVLWSPAGLMNEKMKNLMPLFEVKGITTSGHVDYNGLPLGLDFVEEMSQLNLFEGIETYTGPVLIIQGTQDDAVSPQTLQHYKRVYKQSIRVCTIHGANHTYTSIPWRQCLIQKTQTFLLTD